MTENKIEDTIRERRKSEILMPASLTSLRKKLYQKAKQEPKFRFYALYDRIYRKDVLAHALKCVIANKGSSGVDGVEISDITGKPGGEYLLIEAIHEELKAKRYRPQGIRRVYIPKSNGKQRPLGIPTVKDRVVQQAARLILEPIFEADFEDCSYGFRPGRSAHQALKEIRRNIKSGYREVYDADLQSYFDTIPHDKLMVCIKMRVTDGSVLKLLRMWLKSPVIENGKPPSTPRSGVPQGGVISPLLSNLYLHWFDKQFHRNKGPANFADAKLVRYADDFVVMARMQTNRISEWIRFTIEDWLELRINREKTKVVKLEEPGSKLEFLGFSFSYHRSLYRKGGRCLQMEPSKKAVATEQEKIKLLTSKSQSFLPVPVLIKKINRTLKGWGNYFEIGQSSKAFRKIDWHVQQRLRRHLNRRSQRGFEVGKSKTFYRYLDELGLYQLQRSGQLPVYAQGESQGKARCGKTARRV